jgi:hypothetical protein
MDRTHAHVRDDALGADFTHRDDAHVAAVRAQGGFKTLAATAGGGVSAHQLDVAGRRRVKAVPIVGTIPNTPATGLPTFAIVEATQLLVDDAYQRGLSEKSLRLIRKMVTSWDWRRFKPPVVAKTELGLEVLDGQHTAMAAASHPKVLRIPIMLVEAPGREDRAAAFVSHNRDRLAMTPMQIHFSAVAGGEAAAIVVDQVCRDAGVTILKTSPAGGAFKPRSTVAVMGIAALIKKRGVDAAGVILKALAEADCAPIGTGQIKAAELLLHGDEYAGEIDADGITRALLALGDEADREAAVFAAAHRVPLWKALAIVIFRKGRRRGRRTPD